MPYTFPSPCLSPLWEYPPLSSFTFPAWSTLTHSQRAVQKFHLWILFWPSLDRVHSFFFYIPKHFIQYSSMVYHIIIPCWCTSLPTMVTWNMTMSHSTLQSQSPENFLEYKKYLVRIRGKEYSYLIIFPVMISFPPITMIFSISWLAIKISHESLIWNFTFKFEFTFFPAHHLLNEDH